MKKLLDVRAIVEQTGWGRKFLEEVKGPAPILGGLWGRTSGAKSEAVKRGSEPAVSSINPSESTGKARFRARTAQPGAGWPSKQQPIGEILKACRERAGMTQEELAKRLFVDRSIIARVETGATKSPSYTLVKQWAAATEGLEMVNMDLTGGRDGWKKLTAMETAMKQMKSVLDVMPLRKRGAVKQGGGTR
ncbi:hypothetical protein VE23_25370 [Paenibacillus sp. D9]|uniref:helix-turn-helix domain-containing protein n=1 Tax=Paenibacillus sp. D9 TaxID=665792 RepID=UPI00061F40B9|nr:helix-turn-helix domain-containing protein [Paenibacillus sp. D9]KKC45849.1 hypothetical protein VE23_25370 [Paenibacillus sp. D9]